ncbi:MAG: GAF domain-containing protein, partial [Anaerolineaceae bacterium]|nr:GAF domain-containing protein [Anaerolineaceae bacterium]
MVSDITTEKAAEQRIMRQAAFSQKLANFTELLNAELELAQILEITCSEITQALNIEGAEVTLYDPDKEVLTITHTQGPFNAEELIRTPVPFAVYQQFFTEGRPYLVIPDVQETIEQHPYFHFLVENDIRSAVIVSLSRETQLIGTLDLATIEKRRSFDEEELTFLVTFANHAAIAIDRARMYQQTKRRTEELEVLGRLSAVLRLANSRQEMLPTLLQEAIGLTQADAGIIYLFSQMGNPINSYQRSIHPDQDPGWFTPGGEVWNQALSSDELLIDPILALQANRADNSQPDENPIRSRMIVPFHSTNTLVAVMVLGFSQPRQLDAEDQRIMASLAEMGGNALHRSGLMEMLEQKVSDRTRELSALYDLTVFVNSPLGLDEVLNEALHKIVDVFAASIGLIFRYDPHCSCLTRETQVNMPEHLLKPANILKLSDELIQWLEKSRSPWLVFKEDAQSLPIDLPGEDTFETLI